MKLIVNGKLNLDEFKLRYMKIAFTDNAKQVEFEYEEITDVLYVISKGKKYKLPNISKPYVNGNNKIGDIDAFGSNCLENDFCMNCKTCAFAQQNQCYAARDLKRGLALRCRYIINNAYCSDGHLLSPEIKNKIGFSKKFVRWNAYGELQNETEMLTLFNACMHYQDKTFVLWTKRMDIVNRVFDSPMIGKRKPKNLIIIFSSPQLNKQVSIEKAREFCPYIDKVYTVWSDEKTANENGVEINCREEALEKGGCSACLLCYTLKETYINAVVRSPQNGWKGKYNGNKK